MSKATQIPIQFDSTQLTRLRSLSAESGRSLAALVREAVARYLDPIAGPIPPDSLWSLLRDPTNWQTFKQIAAEMETQASPEPVKPVSVEPAPTWKFRRGDGVTGRNNLPAVVDDEKPPF